jgi:glycosyltransferase involved in cell wall biosynthesis
MSVGPRTNVLLCIDSLASDAGTEQQLIEVVRRVNPEVLGLHVCCLESSPQMGRLPDLCATRVFPVTRVYTPQGLLQIRMLRRYIDANDVDVVHAFMVKATIMGVLAAKGSRCQAVVTSRRNMGYWYTPFYLRLFRYLNRHTTRILANSERVRQFTIQAERISPAKVDVLYNGVDLEQYAPGRGDPGRAESLGIPLQVPVVGIVANYRPVKRLDVFLRAARIVSGAVPQAAFLLVGRGPLRKELAGLARELGIAHKVFFSDGQGSVPDYLQRMAVGCLSSESEGFSNAILEYMAAGLPVVATNVGGNSEAVQDGVNGYLVPPSDPEAFAARVIALLQDEAQRAAMARCSLERCRREFDIAQAVARLERYYLDLAGSDSSRSR